MTRKAPTLIAGLFLGLTLFRVAAFVNGPMQARGLGWLFSIGLALAVYLSAYHTRAGGVWAVKRRSGFISGFLVVYAIP